MEVKAAFQRSRRFYFCQPCDAAAPSAATGVGPVQLLMALPGCSATGVAPDLQLPANKGATSGTTAAAVAVNLPLPPVSSAPAAGTAISFHKLCIAVAAAAPDRQYAWPATAATAF